MPHRPLKQVIENQQLLTAPAETTISEAARLMKQSHVGAMVVVEDKHLIGIFTERDALFRVLAEGRNPQTTTLGDVMTRDPQSVAPDKPLGYALHMMYEGGFRHVPVVENGRLLGIVSARDALGTELTEFESDLLRREHIGEILG